MTYIAPAVTSANNPGLMAALGRANALMAAQPAGTTQTFANPNPVSSAWDWRTGSFQSVEPAPALTPQGGDFQAIPVGANDPTAWWGQGAGQLPVETPLQSGVPQFANQWWATNPAPGAAAGNPQAYPALGSGAETATPVQPANDPLRFAPPPGSTEPTHSQTSWSGAAPAAGLGSMTQPGAASSQQATSAQSQQNTGLSGWGGHKWWSAQPTAGGALST